MADASEPDRATFTRSSFSEAETPVALRGRCVGRSTGRVEILVTIRSRTHGWSA
jgi:hypothetical protein